MPGHSFYKSDCSPFLSEALQMNSAAYGRTSAHYAIYTGDRCIDIISTEEPRFILLRETRAHNRNRKSVKQCLTDQDYSIDF